MPALLSIRAPADLSSPNNIAILATVIGASVGGGTMLILLALVFIYRRRIAAYLEDIRRRQKEKQKEKEPSKQKPETSATTVDEEGSTINEVEILDSSRKERMERAASMKIGSPPSQARRGRQRTMDKSAISRPLNVDPLTAWSRQPPRRSVSLSSSRSRTSSIRSTQTQQQLQSAQSLRMPLGLPASPHPPTSRQAVERQRSLPRLPSQTASRPWNNYSNSSSRDDVQQPSPPPPLPSPVRRRSRRGRKQINRDSIRSIWED